MDPLTIALVLGVGAALFVGLRKTTTSQAATVAQQQTQVGTQDIVAAGTRAPVVTSQLQQIDSQTNQKTEKAIAAGASAALTTASITTFGIAAVGAVAALLWSRHEARIKAAKSENAAMNIAVPGWQQSLLGIVSQYNSGQLTDIGTVGELKQLRQLIFNRLQQYNHTRGVNWSGGGTQPGLWGSTKYFSVKCDKHCTIGCCLYNNVMGPAISNTIALIQKQIPGPTITVPAMSAYPTYGFGGNPQFNITITR